MTGRNARALGVAAAALSGIGLFAAGEPLGLGPLAWVALAPLYAVVVRQERTAWAWLYGLCFGVVYFGVQLSWIFLFGWMAWSALTAFLALFTSVAPLLASLVRRSRLAPLVFAGAWTGVEVALDRWPAGGFPWGAVGTTQASVPGVRWLAGVVGVYGLSFVVVLVAALAGEWLARRRVVWEAAAAAAAVLVAFAAVDLAAHASPPEGEPLRIAVVQGGVPRPPRPDQNAAIVASHVRLTQALLEDEGRVDIVVWPESAVANSVADSGLATVRELAERTRTPFLVGRSFFTESAYFNLVEHVGATGAPVQTYKKRHPVPFGEYVPYPVLRRFVSTLSSQIPVDQRPGGPATVFEVEGTGVATPICFESVFPRDFLDFVRNGAEVFVLSTNNSSFEHSYASQQHVAQTRMRALETRQWVVQAALAGVSAVLHPDGRVSDRTALFDRTAFVAEVRARPAASLYASTGDVFAFLAAGAVLPLLAWPWIASVRGRRRGAVASSA